MNLSRSRMTPAPLELAAAPPPVPGRLVHTLTSIVDRLDFTRLFPRVQPVEIELGAGDGSFLVEAASRNRDHNFLGVERLLGRLRKIDRKGQRRDLGNLLAVRIEASYFLEYLVPEASVTALHVYFPDPWPKRRHAARRLVNSRFPTLVARVLTEGGTVYFRTDSSAYFAQMKSVFSSDARFQAVDTPADLVGITTDFEAEFNLRGIPTLRTAFRQHVPST